MLTMGTLLGVEIVFEEMSTPVRLKTTILEFCAQQTPLLIEVGRL